MVVVVAAAAAAVVVVPEFFFNMYIRDISKDPRRCRVLFRFEPQRIIALVSITVTHDSIFVRIASHVVLDVGKRASLRCY